MKFNKLLWIMSLVFVLMISVVSSASVVHNWEFENSLTDSVGGATLSPLGTSTYQNESVYTSQGILISSGGVKSSSGYSMPRSSMDFVFLNDTSYSYAFWLSDSNDKFSSLLSFKTVTPYSHGVNAWIDDFPNSITCTTITRNDGTKYRVIDSTPYINGLFLVICSHNYSKGLIPDIYVNNTNNSITTSSGSLSTTTNDVLYIGGFTTSNEFQGVIHDVKIFNDSLNSTEINNLFLYDSLDVVLMHNYSLSITQNPLDLNFFTVGNFNVSLSVSDTLGTIPNSTSATINYKTVNDDNVTENIYYLYNSSTTTINFTKTMTKVNDSEFYNVIDESDYLPSVYPFDYMTTENTPKSDYQLYDNRNLLFNIANIDNDSDLYILEFNAEPYSISNSENLHIYQCEYLNPNNCTDLDIFTSLDTPNHQHSIYSEHYLTYFNNIFNSNNMTIKFNFSADTKLNERWNFRYYTNASYTSSNIFQTSLDGVTYTNTSNIFDIHIHQFDLTDKLTYNVTFDDGEGNSVSEYNFDDLDITNLRPSEVNIYSPTGTYTLNSTGVNIFFNWSEAFDGNNDSISYKVAVGETAPTKNISGFISGNDYTESFVVGDLVTGTYRTFIYSSDGSLTSLSRSDDTFDICINNWVATENICIDGVANVTYSDSNSCPLEYEKPSSYLTNCLIESGNPNTSLFVVWGLIFLVTLFLITQGVGVGWFLLPIELLSFVMFSFDTISTDNNLKIVLIIFSVFLLAIAFTRYVLRDN